MRRSCSCGRRGMAEYPLDCTTLPHDKPLYEADIDLSGPISDCGAHLSVIQDAAVPLPTELNEPGSARTRRTNSPPNGYRSSRSRPDSAPARPPPAPTSTATSDTEPCSGSTTARYGAISARTGNVRDADVGGGDGAGRGGAEGAGVGPGEDPGAAKGRAGAVTGTEAVGAGVPEASAAVLPSKTVAMLRASVVKHLDLKGRAF